MSLRSTPWPDGTPAWADLTVPDQPGLAAVEEFYRGLFGWTFDPGTAETAYYTTARLAGRPVVGMSPTPPGTTDTPGAPTSWLIHLAAADVIDRAQRAEQAGGHLVLPPLPVMDFGSMAVLTDPTGATVALWQAGSRIGAEVVNEPGAMVWNEHMSADLPGAQEFYHQLFGYRYDDMSSGDFRYATILLDDDRPIGGIGGNAPATSPAHWTMTFAVQDTDRTVARAVELGGTVTREAQDSPFGRYAGVRGLAGEEFFLMSTTEPSSPPAH